MEREGLGGLRPVVDAAGVADWLAEGGLAVGSLLPAGFAGYARLFHPAHLGGDEVRWETVAAANGRVAHAGMQWEALTGSWELRYDGEQPGIFDEPPEVGSLPAVQAQRLVAVLEQFTTVRECVYAVWDGFGALSVPAGDIARIVMPGRDMLLWRGPLAEAATVSMESAPFDRSPSLWWPTDRAWCVATDVDHSWTYIGAGAACIQAILGQPSLETRPVDPAQGVDVESDTRNPIPPFRGGVR